MNSQSLFNLSGIQTYAKGTVITREGEIGDASLYFLLQGSATAYNNFRKPGQTHGERYGPGNFFGGAALFFGTPSPVTVVASSDIIALSINRQNAPELFASQPALALKVMEAMYARIYALENPGAVPEASSQAPGELPAQTDAPPVVEQVASAASPLFPEGHGSYLLPLQNGNTELLYQKDCACPLCGHSFKSLSVITSKLKLERTDSDLRNHYKDIEPLYYEIVTCPNCLYSALGDIFETAPKGMAQAVSRELAPHKAGLDIKTGLERDTFTVFAGYYLALLCAPHCFDKYQNVTSRLWQRLSRIYQDCRDEPMYRHAVKKCLAEYKHCFEFFDCTEKRLQQVCYTIGDLYLKLGDIENAQYFLFKAKSSRGGTTVMRRQADIRLEDIREMKKQQKEAEPQ